MERTHITVAISGAHVVVVGCGGNIGSHVVSHLGRMGEVGQVTLVDRDVYEAGNLGTQDITPDDVGNPKAEVQAARLRRINPGLDVRAIVDAVENLPLALLRGDVILTCLDSKLARQVVNEKSWQLGVPLVDAGVDGPGLLARVSVYYPGPGGACLQCGWQDADYEAVEQVYPCSGGGGSADVEAPATGAPSALGALAASLQVIECRKVLARGSDQDSVEEKSARELLIDAAYGNLYVTLPGRDPDCRMTEHDCEPVVAMVTCTGDTRLGDVVDGDDSARVRGRIRVLGQSFVTRLTCSDCGDRRDFVRLKPSMRRYWCWRCHGEMTATGFDTHDQLAVESLPAQMLERSLNTIGVRGGDVLEVGTPAGTRRIVVGGGYEPPGAAAVAWLEGKSAREGRHE